MASNKNCMDLNRKPADNLIKGRISGEKGDVVFRYINGRVVALKAEYADNFTSETQERNAEFFHALHKESSQLVALLNASDYEKTLGIKYSPQCLAKYNMKRKHLIGNADFVWYTTPFVTTPVLELVDLLEEGGKATLQFSDKVIDHLWNNAKIVTYGTDGTETSTMREHFKIEYKHGLYNYTAPIENGVKKLAYLAYSINLGQGWRTVAIQRGDYVKIRTY